MELSCSCRTLQSFSTDDTEDTNADDESKNIKPWDILPYNVLVHLVSYLQDVDRTNMALVCKAWYVAAQDPSLWSNKQFFLYSNHQIPKNMKWLHYHRKHLRHATIMCFGTLDITRENFLKQLKNTRLKSLELNGTAYWWSTTKRMSVNSQILNKIIDLIKSQKTLAFLQMRQALLTFETGIKVLDTLAEASGPYITRLGLEDFFCHDETNSPVMSQNMRFLECMSKFPRLSDLTINFQYLTDSLLDWFSNERHFNGVTLKVISWQNNVSSRISISRDAWRRFASACTPARVCLTLQNIKNIDDVTTTVLLPTIPLYRLHVLGVTAVNEREVRQLISLLNHTGMHYGKSLVEFKLWGNNNPCDGIGEALIGLVTTCQSLVDLDLHMDLQPELMGRVCKLQQRRKINLLSFCMARSLSHTAEFDEFRRHIQYWYPIFKTLNMDFQIRAESSPIHSAFRSYSFLVADNHGIVDHVNGKDQTSSWHLVNNNNNTDCNNSNNNNNSNNKPQRAYNVDIIYYPKSVVDLFSFVGTMYEIRSH